MSQHMQIVEAKLSDGSVIAVEIYGEGPTLLLPVNPRPAEGEQAETMRQYGADPALGQSLIAGLSDVFRVVAFGYESHVLSIPRPDTLTPDNVVSDLLAIADAAQADRFAYYGYSWLAVIGLQLAIRTHRLSALIMGGYPPLNGPYAEMLKVTNATYKIASGSQDADDSSEEDEWSGVTPSEDATRQFVTLYEALQSFDDRAAQAKLTCPRLCFVGSTDEIEYGKKWGDVLVSLAGPIIRGQTALETFGWEVHILDGLNHMQAMQAEQVIPVIRPWLLKTVVMTS